MKRTSILAALLILTATLGYPSLLSAGAFNVKSNSKHQWTPNAIWNPYYGRWMYLYVDHGRATSSCGPATHCSSDIQLRIFNWDGSSYITQKTVAATNKVEKDPSGAWNNRRRELFVVWYDNPNPIDHCNLSADIKGRRFNYNGDPIDTNVISIRVDSNKVSARPRIAYSADADRYMVVWQEASKSSVCNQGLDEADWNVWGRVYNADGTARTGAFKLSSYGGKKETPDIVGVDAVYPNEGKAPKFMAVWQDRRYGFSFIIGQRFDASGTKTAAFGNDDIFGYACSDSASYCGDFEGYDYSRSPRIAYNQHDDEFIAVWASAPIDDYHGSGKIFARRLDRSDHVHPAAPVTIDNSGTNRFPDINYCYYGHPFIAWDQTDGDIYIARRNRGDLSHYSKRKVHSHAKAVTLPDECGWGYVAPAWETLSSSSPDIKAYHMHR